MSDEKSNEVEELDLDAPAADLEAAMREAEAAVTGAADLGRPAPEGAEAPGNEAERLRRENAELKDRCTRTLADFDNFRKRSERERQEARRYALLEPLRDLVEVVDNLERALQAAGSAEDLKRGVEMILRQMQDVLRKYGVREVQAAGAPFDPTLHEAVSREERPGATVPTVVEELQRGYLLHDRLLRPARVKVAVPAEGDRGAGEAGGGNGSIPAL
jgi:molecular chaperone GrpE